MEQKTAQYEQAKDHAGSIAAPSFLNLGEKGDMSIVKPMIFWIGILVVGLVLTFALAPMVKGHTNYFASIGKFILYQPGAIILPLVVAVWVSAKIGTFKPGSHVAWKTALLNAIYIAVIYSIAIFIIYLVAGYFAPGTLPTTFTINGFIFNLIVIPVAIVVALIPLLSILSAARHAAA